jgi:hypothetical protein
MKRTFAQSIFTGAMIMLWLTALIIPAVEGQEMIVNGGFDSSDGWTIYDMGGNTPSTATFNVNDGYGPKAGTGAYLLLSGEDTYTNILVWQALTLDAGVTYKFSGAFKDLTDGLLQGLWCEIDLSPEVPVEGTDYAPLAGTNSEMLMNFSSWDTLCAPNVDGTFQDNACGQQLYTAPGTTGEKVTVTFGIKTGVWSDAEPYFFDIAVDQVSLVPVNNTAVPSTPARPENFNLYPNFPNPFNPSTTIRFSLPQTTAAQLSIINIAGDKVRSLFHGTLNEGTFSFNWDGKDQQGDLLPSGIYLYRLEAGQYSETRRMIFLK